MHIVLVGMSNIGKSHWARRLQAEAGFHILGCDDMVEDRLGPELRKLGYAGIHDVAKWMGQPYDPQYAETSRKYLECEKDVMRQVLAALRDAPTGRRYVVDTTGSVIYTGEAILSALKSLAKIIYFEASSAHVAEMFRRYVDNPKPVIWGDSYAPRAGEAQEDALKRCYPELLAFRAQRYRQLADIVVPLEGREKMESDIERLLGLVAPQHSVV